MEIREPTGLDDYRRAVECHNRAWRVGYRSVVAPEVIDAVRRPTDEASLRSLRDEVNAEAGPFLVAEREDRVVGYVRGRYAGVSAYVGGLGGELVALYVDPAHWREGVGSALLGRFVEWLPSAVDGLHARVVAENERGRSFLEAHDLVHEETAPAEVGGESVEHAIYRVGLADDADAAEASDAAAAGGDSEPDVTTVGDVPNPGSFGAAETVTSDGADGADDAADAHAARSAEADADATDGGAASTDATDDRTTDDAPADDASVDGRTDDASVDGTPATDAPTGGE